MSNQHTPSLAPRTARESHVQISQLMGPEHGNLLGHVHGGTIARLVDEAGALAAMRHAHRPVVTVVLDAMTFLKPILLGNLVILDAEVTYVGRTSIEVCIEVEAENVLSGERTHTNTAFIVYVALDDSGKPYPVPPLKIETDADRQSMLNALGRQEMRLKQRKLQGQED